MLSKGNKASKSNACILRRTLVPWTDSKIIGSMTTMAFGMLLNTKLWRPNIDSPQGWGIKRSGKLQRQFILTCNQEWFTSQSLRGHHPNSARCFVLLILPLRSICRLGPMERFWLQAAFLSLERLGRLWCCLFHGPSYPVQVRCPSHDHLPPIQCLHRCTHPHPGRISAQLCGNPDLRLQEEGSSSWKNPVGSCTHKCKARQHRGIHHHSTNLHRGHQSVHHQLATPSEIVDPSSQRAHRKTIWHHGAVAQSYCCTRGCRWMNKRCHWH